MDESEYIQLAIKEARQSVDENDDRVHPKVGVVVVRDGKILGSALRGEKALGDHAEYTLLEKKLETAAFAGSTVYTTLEPCTKRNPPKIPCAERLIDRRVERVVIGGTFLFHHYSHEEVVSLAADIESARSSLEVLSKNTFSIPFPPLRK